MRDTILRLINPEAQYLFMAGHPPATRVLNHRLKRGWDNVFTTLRDPIEIGTSWINYVLTSFAKAPTHPDVVAWRRTLKLPDDAVVADLNAAIDLAPMIVQHIVPMNAICGTLGTERSLQSALDTAAILDLKIIRLEQIDDYIRWRGIKHHEKMNVSDKFVEFTDLDRLTRFALYNKVTEDLKFVDWVDRHAVPGDGPWFKL